MRLEISCSRREEPIVVDDGWPWYEEGEYSLCPAQSPLNNKEMCFGCDPGYVTLITSVRDSSNRKSKVIIFDPDATEIPVWNSK